MQSKRSWTFPPTLAVAILASVAAGCGETSSLAPSVSPSAQATSTAAPSPSPTPLAQRLQVPLTTPVILFHDPVLFDQIDGTTWDGSHMGRVGTNAVPGSGIVANPAGIFYATAADIRDRAGQVVASLGPNHKGFGGTWADDERHSCQSVGRSAVPPQSGEPATLQLAAPGSAPRTIAQVGTVSQQTSVGAAACSVLGDRAVVVQSGGQGIGTRQFWVVQLSTGRILWTKSYASDAAVVTIVASRDGRYVAEVRSATGQASSTVVYGPTGSTVTLLVGAINGFSWDGALAVVSSTEGSVSVIRWQDGSHVWGAPQGQTFFATLGEPGGQHLAVALRTPEYQQFPLVDLYVVAPDGQAMPLLQKVAL